MEEEKQFTAESAESAEKPKPRKRGKAKAEAQEQSAVSDQLSAEELPANFGALEIGPQRLRPRLVIEAGQPGAIQALVAALPLLGVDPREAEKIVREFELYARS